MIKHILVPVDGAPSDERALSAAFGLAHLFAGHVDALHIRPDPRQNVRMIGEGYTADMLDDILVEAERAARETADEARRVFDQAVAMAGAEMADRRRADGRVTASWREAVGWPSQTLGREGRFADLVLLAQVPEDPPRIPVLEAALFDTGRPLFLAAANTATDAFPSVAIGWDGSLPAVRAVAGAMPFLDGAKVVTVLTVEEGMGSRSPVPAHATRLVEHLGWHGIDAVVQPVRRQDRPVGQALAAKATELGAGLLVMGGYGHSRFREMILGGATRYMLGTPVGCSILMTH